jgi:glucosamine-6-phosphate deaminase
VLPRWRVCRADPFASEEGLSFRDVITFNLDEYYPMKPDAVQSYVTFMNENLFDHVDIDKSKVHIPDGTLALEDVAAFCLDYESSCRN